MDDKTLRLKGINWHGFGSKQSVFMGLYALPPHWFLDFLEENHFNAVRIPLDLNLITHDRKPGFMTKGRADCIDNSSAWSKLDSVVRDGWVYTKRVQTVKGTARRQEERDVRDELLQERALVTHSDPCDWGSGKTSLQVLDWFVDAFAARGILVLFDLHCLSPGCLADSPKGNSSNKGGGAMNAIPGLFFDEHHKIESTLNGLGTLARRYHDQWNVLGIDVFNEPFRGTWNEGKDTDMDAYAVEAARRVHHVAPGWLIFVQGTMGSPNCSKLIDNLVKDVANGDQNNCHAYAAAPSNRSTICADGSRSEPHCGRGDNLLGAQQHPVVLDIPERVVYSPHVYGPGVRSEAPEFQSSDFPQNMPHVWERRFGALAPPHSHSNTATYVIGEWGGEVEGDNGVWMHWLVSWLQLRNLPSNFFWHLGMHGKPTGLILDWTRDDQAPVIDEKKLRLLHKLVPHPTEIPRYGSVGLKPATFECKEGHDC